MPKLSRITVKNFRMLRDVDIRLEDKITLIVGRNNSGKTSFSEVIRKFFHGSSPSFDLQDFSTNCFDYFLKAHKENERGHSEEKIRKIFPSIELRLHYTYDIDNPDIGDLSDFIIDINRECNEVIVVAKYQLTDGSIGDFFEGIPASYIKKKNRRLFFREISNRIGSFYTTKVFAEDPNDPSNISDEYSGSLHKILETNFISAQRKIEDNSRKEKDELPKVVQELFKTYAHKDSGSANKRIANNIEKIVKSMQEMIDGNFRKNLDKVLTELDIIDYHDHKSNLLTTETILNTEALLSDHTVVRYDSGSGILLPESSNGLGMRNFIFILLKIVKFYREFRLAANTKKAQIVFIEEPESHLHPQLQQIFIKKIGEMIDHFERTDPANGGWPVQFVVTTHSPHIANESDFSAIRYFFRNQDASESTLYHTIVKDLDEIQRLEPKEKRLLNNDLKRYLTLTRCDLYFADIVILVEGITETFFIPAMIEKYMEGKKPYESLGGQYITIIESGGSHSSMFFNLIDFLNIRTLVISDLDPVKKVFEPEEKQKNCIFHEAETINCGCIKHWFGFKSCKPTDLIKKHPTGSITGCRKLIFQVPEKDGGPCGRTFEDAFILANMQKFGVSGGSPAEQEEDALKKAKEGGSKIEFALNQLEDGQIWNTPRYILNGLEWLDSGDIGVGGSEPNTADLKTEGNSDKETGDD